ncbi:hypothetical protein LEP1GSC133_1541 [Leptospira borgpetersenii serovar Pomona str. 200901868]|uniref:Uncharacterized protein n=1 Tax=Leptospira borgpetersenii serovar Pomona str. 200901868 TaxID=1192866 RepID=M6WTV3_LEPBO|nr:hypothetical protein LEP1GSC133_1541 [Leptospira borgpetersenii serovar Pomona str. 200901868]
MRTPTSLQKKKTFPSDRFYSMESVIVPAFFDLGLNRNKRSESFESPTGRRGRKSVDDV